MGGGADDVSGTITGGDGGTDLQYGSEVHQLKFSPIVLFKPPTSQIDLTAPRTIVAISNFSDI